MTEHKIGTNLKKNQWLKLLSGGRRQTPLAPKIKPHIRKKCTGNIIHITCVWYGMYMCSLSVFGLFSCLSIECLMSSLLSGVSR